MKRSDFGLIILVISGVIILSTTALIIYLNVPVKSAIASTRISGLGKNLSEVEVINQVSVGDVNFQEMNYVSSNILEFEWDIKYSGSYLPHQCIIVKYATESAKIKISVDTLKDISIESLSLNINFNPSYIYSFISNSKSANINFNANNIEVRNFCFNSSSGEINIKLNHSAIYGDYELSSDTGIIRSKLDHLILFNNYICRSNSGSQLHDIWNVKFNSIADINLTSNVGYIQFHWANHFNKSNNVNINVYSNSDFRIKFWCPFALMRGQVSLFTISGSKIFTKPAGSFEEIYEDFYRTRRIDDLTLDLYNISATSTNGQAWVYYVDCFKWSRICDYTQDFLPYDVKLIGNYTIIKEHYDVNTIDFFNDNYIYLNETRTLPVLYEVLSDSSNKILFIDWNIEYIHAMGIGVGNLNLKISKDMIGDKLEVHLVLDFVLDKILPTFNKCNITVYYNPDYVFNHN